MHAYYEYLVLYGIKDSILKFGKVVSVMLDQPVSACKTCFADLVTYVYIRSYLYLLECVYNSYPVFCIFCINFLFICFSSLFFPVFCFSSCNYMYIISTVN